MWALSFSWSIGRGLHLWLKPLWTIRVKILLCQPWTLPKPICTLPTGFLLSTLPFRAQPVQDNLSSPVMVSTLPYPTTLFSATSALEYHTSLVLPLALWPYPNWRSTIWGLTSFPDSSLHESKAALVGHVSQGIKPISSFTSSNSWASYASRSVWVWLKQKPSSL